MKRADSFECFPLDVLTLRADCGAAEGCPSRATCDKPEERSDFRV